MDNKIKTLSAISVIDSRGVPTIQTTVILENGAIGKASVPSGASTGRYEAHEKRDNLQPYNGKGVGQAIDAIHHEISQYLTEHTPKDTFSTDTMLCNIDGTSTKSRLGANTVLSVSLAYARALANAAGLPLFQYLGGINARLLPLPMMNVLNGGAHADNNLDIQEFMIIPTGATSFSDAVRMGCETYAALKKLLLDHKLSVAVGDEGGFAPNARDHEHALQLLCDAIELAGYKAGNDIVLALDIAASEWFDGSVYRLPKQNTAMCRQELFKYYQKLCQNYPIVSLEDPFSEDDFSSFTDFRQQHPDLQIVGDDLFVTNPSRIRTGIELKAANAVLIKPNQIGTLSETLNAIALAQQGGYNTVISHRSGDTEDTFIADLAVAVNAGQIKTGAPCRGERIAKYNRLIEIEALLGKKAEFRRFK